MKGVTLKEAVEQLRKQDRLLGRGAKPAPPPPRIVGRAGDVFGGLFFDPTRSGAQQPQPRDDGDEQRIQGSMGVGRARGRERDGDWKMLGNGPLGDVPQPPERCDHLPPLPPPRPTFTNVLSAEGFARWVKRSELNDDPILAAHCAAVRRSWRGGTLPDVLWPFPTFAPRARPFDWTVDA